jgi:hypothetical protein
MSTITTRMSTEQLEHFLSEAIEVAGMARLYADLHDPDRTSVDHDRALMVQAELTSLYNSLGDGHPAPALNRVQTQIRETLGVAR